MSEQLPARAVDVEKPPPSHLSRPWRWRLLTLALVHLLIAAHIVHWKLTGISLSSIQLSDAGRFASEGVATAALFFFAILLVSTLLFGRFFCSWGCHMLALQEACRLLLGRVGVRPRLIRVRWLWMVPLAAAFYIFFQPFVERAWYGEPFPTLKLQLTSDNLWANLPGTLDGIAAVLVGGLVMVYLLGSLSFCKYVCPYGALFGLADALALGRMRLVGECDGCALCTAACTTGVRVHEELQRFGMVANSGCMRCFQCASACPRRVVAYRFGRPALTARGRTGLTRYTFSLGEEAAMVVFFAASFLALNGLYGAVPLLISLTAGVVLSYLGVMTVRLMRQPFVALRRTMLKEAGQLSRAGAVFLACSVTLALFVLHSLFIQYHQYRADTCLDALGFPRVRTVYSLSDRRLGNAAAAEIALCRRYGLVDTFDWNMKLAWVYRVIANPRLAERHLRRAIELNPTQPAAYFNLGKELARQGRPAEAAWSFNEAARLQPALSQLARNRSPD